MEKITLISFGFLNGLPAQADTVLDVRGLKNPFYIHELKDKSGLDPEVRDYIFSYPETAEYLDAITELLRIRLKLYAQWDSPNRHPLTIAIGCTGGRHRSVAMTEALAERLRALGCEIVIRHRDLKP